MNNRSIEQALTSLIPRHNGSLPPELLQLASSLLAQSRNKAANLKADEEIGRTYACANIACERLKQSLNLPPIEPRPPVPPRVYKKLYTYLDQALVRRKVGRPPGSTKKNSPAAVERRVESLPTRTPLQSHALTPFRSPAVRPSGPSHYQSNTDTSISPWIRPTIRALCIRLSVPAAAPHILAGVSSIIAEVPEVVDEEAGNIEHHKTDRLPALIAAVYFFVRMRLLGKETNTTEYIKLRKEVVIALQDLRAADDGAQEKWQGWEEVGVKDVDGWVKEISSKGFLKLDWFTNIVEGSGVATQGGENELLPITNNEEEFEGLQREKDVLHAGLGTMIQERNDLLSERRREEYKAWETQIWARIAQMQGSSRSSEI